MSKNQQKAIHGEWVEALKYILPQLTEPTSEETYIEWIHDKIEYLRELGAFNRPIITSPIQVMEVFTAINFYVEDESHFYEEVLPQYDFYYDWTINTAIVNLPVLFLSSHYQSYAKLLYGENNGIGDRQLRNILALGSFFEGIPASELKLPRVGRRKMRIKEVFNNIIPTPDEVFGMVENQTNNPEGLYGLLKGDYLIATRAGDFINQRGSKFHAMILSPKAFYLQDYDFSISSFNLLKPFDETKEQFMNASI